MASTESGCVQKQSCTEAKARPAPPQCSAVSAMCDESSEWMKLGGKALRCFMVQGRCCRSTGAAELDARRKYGCSTGRPSGVTHSTLSPHTPDITLQTNDQRSVFTIGSKVLSTGYFLKGNM